jgi:DNA-binding SARP family transcriptional activator
VGRPGDRVELAVLSGVSLRVDGTPLGLSALERALLACLALRPSSTSDVLVAWLYDDAPPPSARNRVQALVSGLRRKCLAPLVRTVVDGYALDDGVTTDVTRWREAGARAREAVRHGDDGGLDDFRTALSLVPDHPLPDVPATAALEAERSTLVLARLAAWEDYAAAARALGRADVVVADLARLTAAHPFHEGLLAHYVEALASVGRREQASREYDDAVERLDVELGVPPSEVLRAAHARVLDGDVRPARGGVGPAGSWPDLGLGHARPSVPRTLPRRSPAFVGRAGELEALLAAAHHVDDGPQVVHLTGLGGMGKSALAIEAGHRLREQFPDGSLHLDAGRSGAEPDVGAALATFLHLLGTRPGAVPADVRERAGAYRSLLHERRVLVVLDDVLPGPASAALLDLLPASAGSMAIVCSRRDLAWLDADLRLRVGSLSEEAGRELLVRELGAGRVERDRAGADQLVSAVGAAPLALRLAAGRARQRPDIALEDLAERLSQGEDGLAASMAASLADVWSQLSTPAQEAARRVAMLPTTIVSAWALGSVMADAGDGERAVDELSAVHVLDPVRHAGQTVQFRLHDVVTSFLRGLPGADDVAAHECAVRVAEDLLDRGDAAHRAHPTQLVPAPPRREGASPAGGAAWERGEAVRYFSTENRMARSLARTLAAARPDLAWRLLVLVAPSHHGAPAEEDWLACLDAVASALDVTPSEDAALGRAQLALCRSWYLQARASSSEQALAVAVRAGDDLVALDAPRSAAAAQVVAASAALALGRRAEAEAAIDAATALLERAPDPVLAGWAALQRGTVHNDYDENEQAAESFARARALLAGTSARDAYRQATLELSRSNRRLGALEVAERLILEVVALLDEDGDEHDRGYVLDAQAEVSVALGRAAEGVDLARQARSWALRSGDTFVAARARRTLAGAMRLDGRVREAEAELLLAVRELSALGRQLSAAAAWRALGSLLEEDGRPAEAAAAYRAEREASAAAQAGDPPPGAVPDLTPPG